MIGGQVRYFQHDEGVWHAYHDGETPALCGEAQLTYNIDRIADYIPYGGQLHEACRKAVDALNGEPEAPAPTKPKVTSTPKTKPAAKTPKTPKATKPKA